MLLGFIRSPRFWLPFYGWVKRSALDSLLLFQPFCSLGIQMTNKAASRVNVPLLLRLLLSFLSFWLLILTKSAEHVLDNLECDGRNQMPPN